MQKSLLKTRPIFLGIFLALILILPGCSETKATLIEGQERDQIVDETGPMSDGLLQAMNDHDYTAFSQNLDSAMLKALPQDAFDQLVQKNESKFGKMVSTEVDKVEKVNAYTAVTYQAKYEKVDAVSVRIVFNDQQPRQIAGLWFSQ